MITKLYNDLPKKVKQIVELIDEIELIDMAWLISYLKDKSIERMREQMEISGSYEELRNKVRKNT